MLGSWLTPFFPRCLLICKLSQENTEKQGNEFAAPMSTEVRAQGYCEKDNLQREVDIAEVTGQLATPSTARPGSMVLTSLGF